jgi:hypothetical protein
MRVSMGLKPEGLPGRFTTMFTRPKSDSLPA